MSIKAKLQLNAILGIVLTVFIGSVLFISNRQIKHANGKVARANEIVAATSEMRFVTFEYLLYHNDRSLEQWQSKYKDISNLIMPTSSQGPAERQILSDIGVQHQAVNTIFTRLVSDYQGLPSNQGPITQQSALDKQLISQLLIRQQTKVSDAFKLTALGQAEISSAINRSNLIILTALAALLVLTAINFVFIMFNITRALGTLQEGAKAIAGGKLSYRIKKRRDDEFGGVATAFNSMAESLEQIDKIKSEFILLASHQLRTPLTSIKWSSEELISSKKTMPKVKEDHYLKQIHDSNERMIKLVSALLNVTKIDFGSLSHTSEPVQLDEALDEVLKDLAPLISNKEIRFTSDVSHELDAVIIDPAWLRIILQNLLTNAIKYSSVGQPITIKIEQQHKDILISIRDKGCGIPAAQQSKVFTKLFRADNAQRIESDGSGLGLYITKAMVELAGGSIWFDSIENHGSNFYVKLPVGNTNI